MRLHYTDFEGHVFSKKRSTLQSSTELKLWGECVFALESKVSTQLYMSFDVALSILNFERSPAT